MTDKQKLIKKIIAMQKEFIANENQHGLDPADYFDPPEGHRLENYKKEHDTLAAQLVDIAHKEKGSHR